MTFTMKWDICLEGAVLIRESKVHFLFQAQIMLNRDILKSFTRANPLSQFRMIRDKLLGTLNMLAHLVVSKLTLHKRLAVSALLTIQVHSRDILNSMLATRTTSKDDFEWTRLLALFLRVDSKRTFEWFSLRTPARVASAHRNKLQICYISDGYDTSGTPRPTPVT